MTARRFPIFIGHRSRFVLLVFGVRPGNHDLTFGGTPRGGVRVDFREAVRRLGISVPAIYLTVEDLEGFAAALAERGLPGTDERRPARQASPVMSDAVHDDVLANAADRDPLA